MISKLLTKSNYVAGLQCPKYLWILIHDREKLPVPKDTDQYLFDQGNAINNLSKELFPTGIDISTDDFKNNIQQTGELLQGTEPLFEAGIIFSNLYSRVDILKPTGEGEWDLIEVKSSTSVKDAHLHDVSFQRFCCEKYGLRIHKCFLMYINNKYIKSGPIDPESIFSTEDITAKVDVISHAIQERLDVMLRIISSPDCPDVPIGEHCSDPYECPLKDYCWGYLPENNIFTLYYSGKKSFSLHDRGIVSIKDIPGNYELSEKQVIQKEALVTGETHLDKEAIKGFLMSLEHPLYYLDFETINPAIPLFNGTRPYQNTPFQFSVHIVRDVHSDPEHYSFLAGDTQDPRPQLLEELSAVLGDNGSIITYNKGFEEGILKDLGKAFPEYEDWVKQVLNRIVDLLILFRNFDYYHPAQNGSASLKAVLPAVTGKGYEELKITDGKLASVLFEKVTYGKVPDEERNNVRSDLEQYCGRDTEGMIQIVKKLREISGN